MPSLYQFTTPVGDVASGDFTTLYNASGLTVPNAGAGAVSGNLNVGGNLTVQGSTLLIGPTTLQSTLCLPNYCFPLPDGTTYQVLATDGSGNLYWTNVGSIPGASYSIQADTATGGANLSLVSTTTTDSVKFAGGTNITVTRTDANTITISTVADNIPDGTAQGQVLVWDGSAWTADNKVTSSGPNDRFVTEFNSNDTTRSSSLFARRNYDSHAYVNGDLTTMSYQVDSASQALTTIGLTGFEYSTTNPAFYVATSTDNFVTRTVIADIDSTDVKFDGTNLVLDANNTGAAQDASITVTRGSSTDAKLTWKESATRWEFTNDLYVTGNYSQDGDNLYINADNTAADSNIYFNSTRRIAWDNANTRFDIGGDIATAYENLYLNTDSTAANSTVWFKGATQYLQWDNTNNEFVLSNSLSISTTTPPAFFERRVTQAQVSSTESKAALRMYQRVTDAANNQTDDGGPGIVFARTSGNSGGAEQLFALVGANYYGTDNTADIRLTWSNDNFSEPTPGNFPGTYTLLRAGSNDASFLNNSLFIDYSAQSTTNTATSITGSNTLVFGVAHGYSAGDRIQFTSTTQNGLTQNAYYYVLSTGLTATQCQLGTTATGSAIALTNGTGLTLVFANLTNQVGINTNTPAYTLDVNGEIYASSDVYINGVQVQITSPNKGNLLYYDGTKFTDSSLIEFDSTTYRPRFQNNAGSSGQINNGVTVSKKTTGTGGGSWVNGDGTGVLMALVDTNTTKLFGNVASAYDTTGNYQMRLRTSNDNFVSDIRNVFTADNTNATVKAQTFTLNAEGTASAAVDAFLTVERGTTGNDVSIKWDESTDRWQFTNDGTTYYNMVINLDDLNDVVITPPTAAGQFLYYNGTNWVNDNKVTSTTSADRAVMEYKPATSPSGFSNALFLRKNTGSTPFTTGDGVGLGFQLDSDSQTQQNFGYIGVINQAAPYFTLHTSTDNFVSNDIEVAKIDSTNINFNGTNLTLNANGTGSAAVDAQITVERGTTGADAFIKWEEANDLWVVNDTLFAATAVVGGTYIGTNGDNIYFNNEDGGSGADSYLTVKRGANADVSVRWNETTDRWQTTTDGSTYLNIPNQNLDTTSDVTFASVTVDGGHTVIDTTTTTTTTTSATAITTTSNATTRSSKFQIQVTDNVTGNIHVLEAMMFFQGATAYLTTYAEMYNSTSLATFSADISGGDTRLLATPASTNSTTFKVTRISVAL